MNSIPTPLTKSNWASLRPIAPKPSSVTITPVAAELICDFVDHVYRLGPRPIFEALCAVHGGADVIETLRDYQRLNPDVVRFLGADRLHLRRRRNGCRHG